ncbi:macro domain-containing protein [Xanthocytophaga agilis]|uniref:Macro domain-containing protein n=1 Tax=Xanthocytophaga agilis TaxID=3048010 RepID=A0AAE3RBN3_9BACT|nr:macro domain-containing protein [Xanthocytophaga agilis]MDJ1505129.1 macro domain-containing protein [Xanthocytophaga agilis]
MKLLLAYKEQGLGEAWREYFRDQPDVQILNTDITQLSCDAIVSPANSFGFMDGGLDYLLSERFGWDLQDRVQKEISELPERELLIGKALVIPTFDSKIPYLISAPTMRVPMDFMIHASLNAYLAMKAILVATTSHPDIATVAIPGLCTGVGKMPYRIAARQMFYAYEDIILQKKRKLDNFGDAQKFQIELNPAGMLWN